MANVEANANEGPVTQQQLQDEIARLDQVMATRMWLAETEVVRLQERVKLLEAVTADGFKKSGEGTNNVKKNGLRDNRILMPEKLTSRTQWKDWSAEFKRWVRAESVKAYEVLVKAEKSKRPRSPMTSARTRCTSTPTSSGS